MKVKFLITSSDRGKLERAIRELGEPYTPETTEMDAVPRVGDDVAIPDRWGPGGITQCKVMHVAWFPFRETEREAPWDVLLHLEL
jgi:hypothetical protein